jgi:hypothetical protein
MILTKNNRITQTVTTANNLLPHQGGINPTTTEGVEFDRRYKLIYRLQDANGILEKTVQFHRLGSDIVYDIDAVSKLFSGFYGGPANQFMYHLRHFVRNIVMIHSTLTIKGRRPKVMKQLRKSAPNFKDFLREEKKPEWAEFLKGCFGAYMWFHFDGKLPQDNCIIFTDVQSMSNTEIDKFMKEAKRSTMHKATTNESDFRQQLKYGYITNEWVEVETNLSGVQH